MVKMRSSVTPKTFTLYFNDFFSKFVFLSQVFKLCLHICVLGMNCKEWIFWLECKCIESKHERAFLDNTGCIHAINLEDWVADERAAAPACLKLSCWLNRRNRFKCWHWMESLLFLSLQQLVGQHKLVILCTLTEDNGCVFADFMETSIKKR